MSGPDVLFSFLATEPVEEFECSLDNAAVRGLRGRVRARGPGDRLAHAARARARPGRAAERRPEPGGPQLDRARRAADADRLDAARSEHERERRVHVLVRPHGGRRRDVPVLGRRLGVDARAARRSPPARWPRATRRAARSTSSRSARSAASRRSTASRSSTRRRRATSGRCSRCRIRRRSTRCSPRRRPRAAGGPDASSRSRFEARDGSGGSTNLATFECSLDGEPFEECEPPLEYEGLEDGHVHAARARARPGAPARRDPGQLHVDDRGRAGDHALVRRPAAARDRQHDRDVHASVGSRRDFECALDTEVFTPCSSPRTYTDIPHGEHEFQVRAKSPAGSVDQTPEVHRWTSGDMTPPVVTINSAPPATTESTTATFAFSSDDPDTQYLCTLRRARSGAALAPGAVLQLAASPTTDLAPGLTYTFTVEPTKPFLLVSAEPAEWEWSIVDTTPPETTIDSGPAARDPARRAGALHVLLQRAGRDVRVRARRRRLQRVRAPHDLSGLEAGEHTLLVRAVDLADPPNVDPTPASRTWTVIGPPTTTLLSAPDATDRGARPRPSRSRPTRREVTFACSLDGLDFAPCGSGVTYEEPRRRRARVHGAGDQPLRHGRGAGVTHTWTIVDATAPDTTIALRPAATTQLPAPPSPSRPTRPTRRSSARSTARTFTSCAPLHRVRRARRRRSLAARARHRPERQRRRVARPPTTGRSPRPARRTPRPAPR